MSSDVLTSAFNLTGLVGTSGHPLTLVWDRAPSRPCGTWTRVCGCRADGFRVGLRSQAARVDQHREGHSKRGTLSDADCVHLCTFCVGVKTDSGQFPQAVMQPGQSRPLPGNQPGPPVWFGIPSGTLTSLCPSLLQMPPLRGLLWLQVLRAGPLHTEAVVFLVGHKSSCSRPPTAQGL